MKTRTIFLSILPILLVNYGVTYWVTHWATAQTTGPTASVLQYHKAASRDGVYVDPLITRARARQFQPVPNFSAPYNGPIFAQPLFVEKAVAGKDAVIVATEQNQLLALDANGGAVLWQKTLGAPVPLASLPCGNIDPLGITGTPIIDAASNTLYVAAMTDSGGPKHLVFALSLADGSIRGGWPVDVAAALAARGETFIAANQNQRGALAILGDAVYIPYGGLYGDCGNYHGWVVGVKLADPRAVTYWRTSAPKGGAWAPGGIASDGLRLYVGTGNTEGATQWSGGDAVIRLGPGATFGGTGDEYFAPRNWQALDSQDADFGSAGPVVFDLAGHTPPHLAAAMGKDGSAVLLDRDHLGGIGGGLSRFQAAAGPIISAPVAFATPGGTLLAFKALRPACDPNADLMALRIDSRNRLGSAWCATQSGFGSPMVTTSDGLRETVVWSAGAEGDNILRAFDGETGATLFTSDPLPLIRRYQTPIAAKGRVYIATDSGLRAFSVP